MPAPRNSDLAALARLHAPRTAAEIRSAIIDMRDRGIGDYEIARATGLAVEQVRRIASTPPPTTTAVLSR